MALIECSECGKQISDKAAMCIGCGAPVVSKTSSEVDSAPTRVSVDLASGIFSGTRPLICKIAVKAIGDVGYRVDSVDENNGLVAFTTGMTWGSFSGVSGTLVIEEVARHKFRISGSAKQNIRGGQLAALNLFDEANKKVAKVRFRMIELSK